MESGILILDAIIITLGIPFLIAMNIWLFKRSIAIELKLKIAKIDIQENTKQIEKGKKTQYGLKKKTNR